MVSPEDLLRTIPLFQGLTSDQLRQVHERLLYRTYPAKATLLVSGQRSELLFVVLSGSVKVCIRGLTTRKKVNQVLQMFTAQRYISLDVQKRIVVQNSQALMKLCQPSLPHDLSV